MTAVALQIHSNEAAAAHFAGFMTFPAAILGLTPQALAGVRSADSLGSLRLLAFAFAAALTLIAGCW